MTISGNKKYMRFLCSSNRHKGQNTSATKFNLFTLAFQKLTAVNTETKKGGEAYFNVNFNSQMVMNKDYIKYSYKRPLVPDTRLGIYVVCS